MVATSFSVEATLGSYCLGLRVHARAHDFCVSYAGGAMCSSIDLKPRAYLSRLLLYMQSSESSTAADRAGVSALLAPFTLKATALPVWQLHS